MQRLRTLALASAVLLLLDLQPLAANKSPSRSTLPTLEPDRVVSRTLTGTPQDPNREVYQITIGDDILQAEFEVFDTNWDFDLYLSTSRTLEDLSAAEFAQKNRENTEKLVLNRFWGDGKLESGTWYLHLVANAPNDIRRNRARPTYSVVYRVVRIQHRPLQPGIHSGELSFANGSSAFYYFDIREGIDTFTVALADCQMDTDLYLKRDVPFTSYDEAEIFGESYQAREMVVLRREDIGAPLTGRWYLVVTQKPSVEHSDRFTLYLGPGSDVPAAFKAIPDPLFPTTTDPLVRAAQAVVEILHDEGGGSGCLVSPGGLIVTNHHVITDRSRKPFKEVVIGLNRDLAKPSTELFLAEVLWSDAEKDLAVLQIRRGLYGQPLPSQLRFPFLEANTRDDPALGSEVWALGYPYWGGRGTKTSITLSRGIVSGFEDTRLGRVYKIDAAINHGSSGGAVLDRQNRLIGVATSVIYDQSGQLGFVHPLRLLPRNWLERLGR